MEEGEAVREGQECDGEMKPESSSPAAGSGHASRMLVAKGMLDRARHMQVLGVRGSRLRATPPPSRERRRRASGTYAGPRSEAWVEIGEQVVVMVVVEMVVVLEVMGGAGLREIGIGMVEVLMGEMLEGGWWRRRWWGWRRWRRR